MPPLFQRCYAVIIPPEFGALALFATFLVSVLVTLLLLRCLGALLDRSGRLHGHSILCAITALLVTYFINISVFIWTPNLSRVILSLTTDAEKKAVELENDRLERIEDLSLWKRRIFECLRSNQWRVHKEDIQIQVGSERNLRVRVDILQIKHKYIDDLKLSITLLPGEPIRLTIQNDTVTSPDNIADQRRQLESLVNSNTDLVLYGINRFPPMLRSIPKRLLNTDTQLARELSRLTECL
jgi:hypothetical protein